MKSNNGWYSKEGNVDMTGRPSQIDMDAEAPRDQDVNKDPQEVLSGPLRRKKRMGADTVQYPSPQTSVGYIGDFIKAMESTAKEMLMDYEEISTAISGEAEPDASVLASLQQKIDTMEESLAVLKYQTELFGSRYASGGRKRMKREAMPPMPADNPEPSGAAQGIRPDPARDYHDWDEYAEALKSRIELETGYRPEVEWANETTGSARLYVDEYELTADLYYADDAGWLCHSWDATYMPEDGEPEDAGSLSCTYGDIEDTISTLKNAISILEGREGGEQ